MSISQNFPEEGPTLNLNFAGSKTLDPRITFSRTTTGTYMDDSGLIKVAPADAPRFDHDPVTGECLGLLIEESSSNLITYSEDFTQSIWDSPNNRATRVTSTGIDDPSGGTTAATYKNGGTAADELIWRVVGGTANVPYTMSVWIRRRTGTGQINLVVGDNISVEVTNQVTTEWKRISVTATPTQTTIRAYIQILGINDEIDIWGYQLEQKTFPTSYIPTSGGTATRNPDSVTMTGDNFSDWYNSSEWTLMIAARRNYSGNFLTYPNLARINDGTANNNVGFYGAQGSTQFTNYGVNSGGVNQTDYVLRFLPDTSQFKMIQALKENDSTFGVNGTLTTTDTSVLMPVGVNQLLIGSDGAGSRWGATIQQLTYYPVRLPNSTLQTLTK